MYVAIVMTQPPGQGANDGASASVSPSTSGVEQLASPSVTQASKSDK
jgi:hypothetical protein